MVLREKIVCGSLNVSERTRAAAIQDIGIREMREQRKRLDLRTSRVGAAIERLPIHTKIMARKRRRQTGLRRPCGENPIVIAIPKVALERMALVGAKGLPVWYTKKQTLYTIPVSRARNRL